MIRIALIGSIGAGKTFVSKCFKYPLFNADQEVNKIYKKNKTCFQELKKKFPSKIKNFPILKSELRNILTKRNIRVISKIVHPYVRKNLEDFLKKNSSKKYVILDIPLLIENKLNKKSDILIYVKTQKKIIQKRLKKRGNYNKKFLKILENQQIDKFKKIKLSNFIIDNSYNKKNIIKQVRKIKKHLND